MSIPNLTLSLRQAPHHSLECHKRNRIRWKCSQEARQKPPPVSSDAILFVHRHGSLFPTREFPFSIVQSTTKRISHDPLLHHITRVTRQPEDLCRQASRPEIYRRRTEVAVFLEHACEDIVGAPPEEEEGAEEEGRGQAVVDAWDTVEPVDLPQTVDGALVQPRGFRGGVLDLQACFDVFHRRGDERYRRARHHTCQTVSD